MGRLTIVSAGPGSADYRSPLAEAAISRSDVVLGRTALLETIDHPHCLPLSGTLTDMVQATTWARQQYPRVTLLLSGDATFLSLLKHLVLDEETEVIPGTSSFQYFAARLRVSWEQAALISLHGRADASQLVHLLETGQGGFVFPGGRWNLARILQLVSRYNHHRLAAVGIDLSFPGETILQGPVADLVKTIPSEPGLAILYLYPDQVDGVRFLPDEAFLHPHSPLSKQETRMVAVGALQLAPGLQVLEIGAGSGGMTVEMARRCPGGQVTTLEHDESTLETLRLNLERFQVTNVSVVAGHAPEAVPERAYHRVFIGGSGGTIEAIIEKSVHLLIPGGILAFTAITLPTLVQGLAAMENQGLNRIQCIQQQISRLNMSSRGRMFRALNPVCIIWGDKHE